MLLRLTLVAVIGSLLAGCRQALPPAPHWREVAPGMEVRQFGDPSNPEQRQLTAVRIVPQHWTFHVVDVHHGVSGQGAEVETVCPPLGAAINGSYFAEDMAPLGLLVVDGKVVQHHFPRHEWGAFRIRNGRPEVVRSVAGRLRGVRQALECKPRLIVHGKLQRFKPQGSARRSAVGIDGRGRVIFAATGDYLTLEQWAAVLRKECGCVEALNLDGGPSTQLAVRGQVNVTLSGGWPVPVFLTASPRK